MAPKMKDRKVKRSVETEEHKRERRVKARIRHWRRTGVSDRTIDWMKREGWL